MSKSNSRPARMRAVRSVLLSSVLAAAAWVPSAYSADVTAIYVGPPSGSWNNPANWNPANTPNNGADSYSVIIDNNTSQNSSVTTNGAFTVSNLTVDLGDSLTISNNTTFTIAGGTLTNNGAVNLGSTGNLTRLALTGDTVTLAGTGTIFMSNNINNQISAMPLNMTVINAATHSIQGTGVIGGFNAYHFLNLGTVTAVGTDHLVVSPGTVTNNGVLRAGDGTLTGTLRLENQSYLNANGSIIANDGSIVELRNGAGITGGLLITNGSGAIQTLGGHTVISINGATLTGGSQIRIVNNSQVQLVGGAVFTNNGTVAINGTGNETNLRLAGTGTVTLAGSGSVTMTDNANSRFMSNGAGMTLVNGPSHLIIGGGGFIDAIQNFTLINEGTIAANGTMTVRPGAGAVNNGILSAGMGTLTGTLILENQIQNAGGTITAADGSVVSIRNGVHIIGGLLSTNGSGSFQTLSGHFFPAISGATLAAGSNMTVVNNSALVLNGGNTFTNNGVVTLTGTGNATNIRLGGDTVTLAGSGTIVLSNNDATRILANATGTTLINGAGHVIMGGGGFTNDLQGYALVNNGVIASTGPSAMSIRPGLGTTNNGVISAGRGTLTGSLILENDTLANTNGILLATDGSVITLRNGSNIVGGLMVSNGSGTFVTQAGHITATLTGTTLATGSTMTVVNNSAIMLAPSSTFTNNGFINFASTGSEASFRIQGPGTVTIAGSGTISMSSNFNNRFYASQTGSTLTHATGHTIIGAGAFSNGLQNYNLVNQGTIIGQSNNQTPLSFAPGGTVVNSGLIQAAAGSNNIVSIAASINNAGGTISALDQGRVFFENGTVISDGFLSTSGAGQFLISSGHFSPTLTNSVTLTTGTQLRAVNNSGFNLLASANATDATYTNNGNIALQSNGNQSRIVLVSNDTSSASTVILAGSGSVTMSDNANNFIYSNTTGATFINAQLIRGAGQMGNGNGFAFNFINNGTVVSAGSNALILSPGGTITNNGLLAAGDAAGTGLLNLQNQIYFNTNGTIAANDGSSVRMLAGGNIVGGTILANGSGNFSTQGGHFTGQLSGSIHFAAGTYNIVNNSATRLAGGGVYTLDGTIQMLSGGNHVGLAVNGAGTTILRGAGGISMSNNAQNIIFADTADVTLINETLITGSGQFGNGNGMPFTLVNNGTITAVGNASIVVAPGVGTTNNALMQAGNGTDSGILDLRAIITNNGTIHSAVNSVVLLRNGTNIVGGTLSSNGTGSFFQTFSGNFDPLITGPVTFSNGLVFNVVNNSALNFASGSTYLNNGLINLLSGGNATELRLNGQGTVTLGGSGTLTSLSNSSNRITANNTGVTFINAAPHIIQGSVNISANGQAFVFVNNGTVRANNPISLNINPGTSTTNNGVFEALNGSNLTVPNAAILTNSNGGTLTGGTYRVVSTGTAASMNLPGPAITRIAANTTVELNGAPTSLIFNTTALDNSLTTNDGALLILNNRNYSTALALANNGLMRLGGGTLTPLSLTNNASGTFVGFGRVAIRPTNHGSIVAQGGLLTFDSGIQGGSGTIQIDPDGILNLAGGALPSSADNLIHNGTGSSSLIIGANNVLVAQSYTNANFGVGNNFNKHANISATTGKILADGTNVQVTTGDLGAGDQPTPTMSFGHIHVGDTKSFVYQVNNIGAVPSSGPAVLYAVQTTVNGANLTDLRLTGSGVTAQNLGPVARGSATAAQNVLFSGLAAGSLTGQSVHIANNFDGNTAATTGTASLFEQTIQITGAAYRYAAPIVQGSPIALGTYHVGDVIPVGNYSLSNNVPNDGFSEKLDAAVTGATGNILIGGSVNLLLPGATNNTAITATLAAPAAGHHTGSATLTLVSNGEAPGTLNNSGLGTTTLTPVIITAAADVFRYAAPVINNNPVNFGNRHVGDVVNLNIGLTNNVPNDGFSEKLDGNISGASGSVAFAPPVSLLNPGATHNIVATLDTATAGTKSGSASLTLISNGSGTSGLANTTLSTVTLTGSGTVYRYAAPQVTNNPVTFANAHVGDTVTQNVQVGNIALNDGLSESLDGALSAPSGANTFTGTVNQLAPNAVANLVAHLNTSTAGAKIGSANLSFASNGAGSSGLGITQMSTVTLTSSGNVYRLASAADIPNINLGTVHVGDTASATLSINNTAVNDGFSEKLLASFSGATGAASTSGGPVTVNPGAINNLAMTISLNTATAALAKTGTGTVQYSSDGDGSSGLGITALPGQSDTVSITANVLNFAKASFQKDTGDGVMTIGTNTATLDFGTIDFGDSVAATLSLLNIAAAPADTLAGSWAISAPGFFTSNFDTFEDIEAGNAFTGLNISFNGNTAGVHTGTITLTPLSQNDSGFSGALTPFTINLSVNVNPSEVPEPASLTLLLAAAPLLLKRRRKV